MDWVFGPHETSCDSVHKHDMMGRFRQNGYRKMKARKQKGLSLIGFILVLSLVIFTAYIGMRIIPIYLEYYSVVSAMDGVAKERGSADWTLFDTRVSVLNRLYVSQNADNVKEKDITVVRRNGVQLRVAYEVRKPLIGNLDVVATFDRMVRLAN